MKYVYVNFYEEICDRLELPDSFKRVVIGSLKIPHVEDIIYDPFPPVLIPLWVTGSRTITGLWKHWFGSARSPTYASYYGTTVYGSRNIVFEAARTFRQLLYVELYEFIEFQEGIDEKVRDFADACGIDDVEVLDRISLEIGDVKGLCTHPEFAGRIPLSLLDQSAVNEYNGDFPTAEILNAPECFSNYCVFEVHSGYKRMGPDYTLRNEVSHSDAAPPWFMTTMQRAIFDKFLKINDYWGAWMCLNSPRWVVKDARAAILKLAEAAGDSDFGALAELWAGLPFEDDDVIGR